MKRPDYRRVLGLLLTLVSLVIPAYFFYLSDHAYFALHRMENDEGYFVWGGWSIRQGLTPYRDFIEFKPPILFITHALAQAVFGLEGRAYRHFFLLLPLGGLMTFQLALVSRRVSRWIAGTLACSLTYLLVHKGFHDSSLGDSESIGLGYFLVGFGLFLLQTRFRRTADAVGAVFFCCSVFSKEPYAPQVALAWVCVLLLRDGLQQRRHIAWPMLKWSLAGIAVFVVALLAYMVPTGAMSAYLDMAARYARLYQDPMQGYCVVLGRVHPSTPLHDLHKQWDQARLEFVNTDVFGFLIPFALLAVVFVARRSWVLFVAAAATAASAFWAVRASNCQWMHYYLLAHAGIFTVLALGCVCSAEPLALAPRSVRAWAIACVDARGGNGHGDPAGSTRCWAAAPRAEADGEPVSRAGQACIDANCAPGRPDLHDGEPVPLRADASGVGATRYSTFDDEIMAYYPGTTRTRRSCARSTTSWCDSRPALVFLDA